MAETEIRSFTFNFGPQHPAAHGVLRLVLEMDGEIVERADPHIGLLHRGTEKLIEHKTYLQALPYFDRFDYISMMAQEHCYCLAVEKLLGIEAPERAKYIRVLFDEITRILNHTFQIAANGLDIGAMTPFLWLFEQREMLLEFYERVSGARMHAAYVRPGGVHQDMPKGLDEDIMRWAEGFPQVLDDVEGLLTENRIWKQRNVDIAAITTEQALDWGFSGPMLRSTGAAWDLRKAQPYAVYDRMDFDIPVGTSGEPAYHRAVPRGDARRPGDGRGQQDRAAEAGRDEALDGGADPPLQALHRGLSRSRRRNLHGDRGAQGRVRGLSRRRRQQPPLPLQDPGSGIDFMTKGHQLADVVACIASMDVVFGEVDR
jgi:NADH-quinone oxidoreductase subunit D